MRRLRDRTLAPRQLNGYSFRYVHPDGRWSNANDWWTWRDMIRKHYLAMGQPLPDNFMQIAEDQLCGSIPPHDCIYDTGERPPVDVRIGLSDVWNWVKSVGRMVLSGAEYVPQEEADRRAAICVACPLNVDVVNGCGQCHSLVEAMTPDMQKRSTAHDGRLRSCAVCKCFNRVQVHFPLAVLARNDTPERQAAYPSFCWKSESHKATESTESAAI